MARPANPANFWQGSLNTLAQSETGFLPEPAAILYGKGSDLGNEKTLKGKAKRKIISQKLSLSLLDIANSKGHDHRKKAFWNTYYCQQKLISSEGKLHGIYCKNRFCTICSAIRKAEIINRYYPVLKTWKEPYFVTLTIKACKAKDLKRMLNALIRAFQLITSKYRKRNLRGSEGRLIGVKSLECNFNPVKGTYNPHLHLIVPDKETANILMSEWLKKWTTKFAMAIAQNKRPVENVERDLVETIKYGSKIFTEPDVNKKSKNNPDRDIYAAALYNIFEAMRGLRIFDRFGFDLPKAEKKTSTARATIDFRLWIYSPEFLDWISPDHEATLTGFAPKAELTNLLENRVNKERE